MITKISRDFALFLKENKIYTNFLRYTRDKNIGKLSIRSFDWHSTSEGYTFWREVAKEYDELLSKRLEEYWTDSYVKNKESNFIKTYGNYQRPKDFKNY
jgi:hypothetical protein